MSTSPTKYANSYTFMYVKMLHTQKSIDTSFEFQMWLASVVWLYVNFSWRIPPIQMCL